MSRRRVLLLAVAVTAWSSAPALGHVSLSASWPPHGAVLRDAPGAVVLTFGSTPAEVVSVTVRAGGADVAGEPRSGRDARRVAVPLRPAAGRHRVEWRVRAADGDLVAGAVAFRVLPPPAVASVRALGARLVRVARSLTRTRAE